VIGDLPPGATRLVLVRHCEADVAPGVLCGRLDPPLTPAGRARAERLAAWLSSVRFAAAYASPARRALATAEAIAAPRGLGVTCDEALWEVAFGALEGLTWAEAAARHPSLCATWLASPHEVVFPGGEGYRDVVGRASGAVEAILARHQGSAVLVVAHGGVNRAVLAWALGVPPERAFHLDQRLGAVNVLDRLSDGPFVLRLLNGASA
jgi:alpha-ribazole phosphatase/probable phosphoglycerate mutase